MRGDKMNDFYIGRQPILDEKGHIFAYEILYRSQGKNGASVTDNAAATARVLINAMQNFGLEKLLGGKKGFINAEESMILDGAIDLLPKESFVIEVLESTVMSRKLVEKIKYYISKGYRFALDDVEFTPQYMNTFEELFPLADYLKIDYMLSDKEKLAANMNTLHGLKAKTLAEKVETHDEYEKCRRMGFNLFQGYYFAKPVVISQKAVDPSKAATVQLINMLRSDAEATEIEKVIKNYPDLYLNLLKFMNSSAFFTRGTVTSIKHAMAMLGRANLSKWLYLILYAGPNNDSEHNPVLITAQIRAKTMERLCQVSPNISKKADSAYLVGLMSLLDVIFSREIEDIVKEFNVDEEIKQAVTKQAGDLGLLLKTVKCYESDDVCEIVDCFGMLRISFDEFNRVMMESYDYTNNFLI